MAPGDALKPAATAIFWFRRDLRLDDNTALIAALESGLAVQPVFIFDPNILGKLKLKDDRRVTFIYNMLAQLDKEIRRRGGALRVFHGRPSEIFSRLFAELQPAAVYCNEDYEPYARERDAEIQGLCKRHGTGFFSFKDHVIFAPSDVLKDDGKPYHVFTPYSRRWLMHFEEKFPIVSSTPNGSFVPTADYHMPSLADLGFEENKDELPAAAIDEELIRNYHQTRDLPALRGASRLGLHLRFGTISIRKLALAAHRLNPKYLAELIWREFYQVILWYYPETTRQAFRPEYRQLDWPGSEADFKKWAAGETGYPLVDAGIRELLATGFMHNRVRMVAASFLTKHLLCDWRWGESFFAQHLADFELASNVGGWQWSAGIGVDAAPYFRIFNPAEQQKKFDPKREYIERWLDTKKDFFGTELTHPMIEHRFARERCLKFFSAARPDK